LLVAVFEIDFKAGGGMRRLQVWWVLMVLVLSACVTMTPTVAPKNFEQSVAYAYASVSASYGIVTDLVTRDRISKDDGKKYVLSLDKVRTDLDASLALYKAGDKATAENQLETANLTLRSIETALKARMQ
jgi:hypothetical protein